MNSGAEQGHTVAIIHARGGSKRVPRKNVLPLAGQPLVSYIVRAACAARTIERVIISSDDAEIIAAATAAGAEAPFVRPARLAEDVPSEWVTLHAVEYLEQQEKYPVAIAVTMQPTTPLTTADDIDACVTMLRTGGFDGVASAKPVTERPEWMYRRDADGRATNFLNRSISGWDGVSQTLPALFTTNGGVYATWKRTLVEQQSLFGTNLGLHVMPLERSVDIDEPIDFVIAEALLQRQRAHGRP